MTQSTTARASLEQAQSTFEQCRADLAKVTELLPWLQEAADRLRTLSDYYGTGAEKDIAAVLADDPAAVTPPVANEDAVWELMADFDDTMMRLLRFATAEVTSRLDEPDACAVS